MFRLIDGFETIDVDIPADEPAVSLERVRWLGRDFFKYKDFYTNMFASWMGDFDNPVINMRTVVSGPLKLRSMEPIERDIQLFKKALRHMPPTRRPSTASSRRSGWRSSSGTSTTRPTMTSWSR